MNSPRASGKLGSIGRWILVLLAVLVGSTFLATGLVMYCAPTGPATATSPQPVPPPDTSRLVHAAMRNVHYRVDDDIVMRIRYLIGSLVPTHADSIPVFDQPTSFSIRVTSAEIALDTVSLSQLLNRYVFGYRGAPIHDLHVSVEGEHLKQRGKLGNVSFTILAEMSVTGGGLIRLHPVDVKVLGINADGLMDKLGIELEELVKVRSGGGIRIEENDFLLDPGVIVPPPRIDGTLKSVRLTPGAVVLQFGPPDSLPARPYFSGTEPAANFMSFTGSRLRFGKLTMSGTDMFILDPDPSDPFDFSLAHYHEQLVAG
ncbi:MAG: hypothetical protein ABI836_07780, partial [Gemmatimonadota bacterium]